MNDLGAGALVLAGARERDRQGVAIVDRVIAFGLVILVIVGAALMPAPLRARETQGREV